MSSVYELANRFRDALMAHGVEVRIQCLEDRWRFGGHITVEVRYPAGAALLADPQAMAALARSLAG